MSPLPYPTFTAAAVSVHSISKIERYLSEVIADGIACNILPEDSDGEYDRMRFAKCTLKFMNPLKMKK